MVINKKDKSVRTLAVSYTHLDVYKRQVLSLAKSRTVEVIFHTDNCDNIIEQIAAIVPIAA